jgi:2-dehydro-3-deoxyphosphogluconate aldolase / (4S)-4-hydroxy-2-oxoglutarate aldolase
VPILELLREDRLLAVLRGSDADVLVSCASVLADSGVRVVELTLSSPAGLDALRRCTAELAGDVLLGAGTVLDAGQARAAVDAGARYLVTPGVAEGVLAVGQALGVPVLCGALTPTEVMTAVRLGAAAVKVFPISAMGGPRYLRDLRAPFPGTEFIAIGGVGLTDVPQYLDAGALAVGVGSPLLGTAAEDTGWEAQDGLARRARDYLTAARPRAARR